MAYLGSIMRGSTGGFQPAPRHDPVLAELLREAIVGPASFHEMAAMVRYAESRGMGAIRFRFDDDAVYAAAAARPSQRPTRHFCTVTGWLARQRDSASGMRFATRAAYEQIREQPPPWARLSGIAPHHEAMRILAQQQQGGGGSNGQDAGQEEYY